MMSLPPTFFSVDSYAKAKVGPTLDLCTFRECVSAGAAGARTRRFLGHHFLYLLFLKLLVLCAPADFKVHRSLL